MLITTVPAPPTDLDPMVFAFWTGVADLITLFAACISVDPNKGDQ
jgi:hypothetical protein